MPPKYEPPTVLYATEIEGRYPKFKIHKTLGHARAALTYRSRWGYPQGIVYTLNSKNEWVIFEENILDPVCTVCGVGFGANPDWRNVVMVNGKRSKDRTMMHRNCKAEQEGKQWWVFNPTVHTVYGPFEDAGAANRYLTDKPPTWMAMPHAALKNYNGLKKMTA